MTFEPSSVLEVLRDHIHSEDADWTELDALMYAMGDSHGDNFEPVRDYLVDQAAAMLASQAPVGWELLRLATTHAAHHRRLMPVETLEEVWGSWEGERPPAALDAVGCYGRRGRLSVVFVAGCIGDVLTGFQLQTGARSLESVIDAALVLLALCYAGDVGDARKTAEQLLALLRGADFWNARMHALALLGEAFVLPPDVAHRLFSAFMERLSRDGAAYLRDEVRMRTIGMREVRFAPLSAFVQVAMPAAAVADVQRNAALWDASLTSAIAARLWGEAKALLGRCGVILPAMSEDTEPLLEPYASLSGPDGTLAVQCALACAHSLLALGQLEDGRRLARGVRHALHAVDGPARYSEWARRMLGGG